MDNLPTIPIDNTSDASRSRKVNSNIGQNRIVSTSDVIVKKGPNGTKISIAPRHKKSFRGMLYRGEFDPNARYVPQDTVRVLPNKDYGVQATAGGWVCRFTVPDKAFSDAIIEAGLDVDDYPGLVRFDNVNYAPHMPEPTTTASLANVEGRYWDAYPPLVETKGCVNNETVTTYQAKYISGSI